MKLLINAIALRSAGPRKILDLLLRDLNLLSNEIEVTIFVDSSCSNFYDKCTPICAAHIIYLTWPNSCWISKLIFEYFWLWIHSFFHSYDCYLSMGDVNSNVCIRKRFTYFHNPSPFNSPSFRDLYFSPGGLIYTLFAKKIVSFNSQKYSAIAQTQWMLDKLRCFPFKYVYLAPPPVSESPSLTANNFPSDDFLDLLGRLDTFLIYPCAPRPHKYIEDAIELFLLGESSNVKLLLTLNGSENRYSRYLHAKYSKYQNIVFFRFLNPAELQIAFQKSSAMLFTSRLETFGLPLREYSFTGKPIVTPNLPYAKEVLCEYDQHFVYNVAVCPFSNYTRNSIHSALVDLESSHIVLPFNSLVHHSPANSSRYLKSKPLSFDRLILSLLSRG